MYYPCSENKDADQLRGYREADLRLCFRIGRLLVFSRTCSIITVHVHFNHTYSEMVSNSSITILQEYIQSEQTSVVITRIQERRNILS